MSPNNSNQQLLRQLPAIESLLQQPQTEPLICSYGRSLVLETFRDIIDDIRQSIISGETSTIPGEEEIIKETEISLAAHLTPSLYPLINATGVIIHTNLGRAPLSSAALNAVESIAAGYSTLEYDPRLGSRGSRTIHAEAMLRRLTGADAALVVNNNAAAVLLMLSGLCKDREVIISRGQLVEIGGGFRVPDVMAQSGAKLVEVGTTNRTHLSDYANAISSDTAAILVAHHSNYRIIGFTSEPSLAELAELAHQRDLLLLYDQGSGALVDVAPFGLEPEPTVQEGLRAGVDIIAFSGDKLLGGPQAGILCGRQDMVNLLKKHPLARAVRADKLCLAALNATLTHYIRGQHLQEIPVWAMIAKTIEEIEAIAGIWAAALQDNNVQAAVIDGRSQVGGGSLPGTDLPTKLLAIEIGDPDALALRLRQGRAPVIARIQDNRVLLDPRTVLPGQENALLETLMEACIQR